MLDTQKKPLGLMDDERPAPPSLFDSARAFIEAMAALRVGVAQVPKPEADEPEPVERFPKALEAEAPQATTSETRTTEITAPGIKVTEATTATSTDKTALESKKFLALLLTTGSTVLVVILSPIAKHYGIPEDLVGTAINAILGLGVSYLGLQGIVDGIAASKPKK